MALYKNNSQSSAIDFIEFSPIASGNVAYFHVDHPEHVSQIKEQAEQMGQKVIAQTTVHDRNVLVTQGLKHKDELLMCLEDQGDTFALVRPEEQLNIWKMRGNISNVGQTLNVLGTHFSAGNKTFFEKWGSTGTYAILSLLANQVNKVFGAEHSNDENRLKYIKEEFNNKLSNYLPEGVFPPDIKTNLSEAIDEPDASVKQQSAFTKFMAKNSVKISEIGLRALGAIALVIPMNKWGKGISVAQEEGIIKGFSEAKNEKTLPFVAGLFSVFGKAMLPFAKQADPYDDTPKTSIDKIREDVIFRAASVSEGITTGILSYDAFSNKKLDFSNRAISEALPNKLTESKTKDFLGGVGFMGITAGFATRFFAPLAEREVDFRDLGAHVADGLAKVPTEKLPQLVADTAAMVKNQFPEKNLEFGKLYDEISTDLYKYHRVAIKNIKDLEAPQTQEQDSSIQFAQSDNEQKTKHHTTQHNTPDTKVSALPADIEHLAAHGKSITADEAVAIS